MPKWQKKNGVRDKDIPTSQISRYSEGCSARPQSVESTGSSVNSIFKKIWRFIAQVSQERKLHHQNLLITNNIQSVGLEYEDKSREVTQSESSEIEKEAGLLAEIKKIMENAPAFKTGLQKELKREMKKTRGNGANHPEDHTETEMKVLIHRAMSEIKDEMKTLDAKIEEADRMAKASARKLNQHEDKFMEIEEKLVDLENRG